MITKMAAAEGDLNWGTTTNSLQLSESIIVTQSSENDIENVKSTPTACNKRKLKDTVSPSSLTSKLSLIVNPEGSIVVSPDHKKRPVVIGTVTTKGADASTHDKSSSEEYDTDDNIPLSQYGSSTETSAGTGGERPFKRPVRKQKSNTLRRALYNRAKCRAATRDGGHYGAPKANPSTFSESEKENNDAQNRGVLGILTDIQARMTRMEEDGRDTKEKLEGIGNDMKSLKEENISKQDLSVALQEIKNTLQEDIKNQETRIEKNENQLELLTQGLNRTSVGLTDLKKKQNVVEEELLKFKSEVEAEKVKLNTKMAQLDNRLEKMNITSPNYIQKDDQREKDLKNLVLEGLVEDQGEDVYDVVIRAVKEIGINIFENDINVAYRIGSYKANAQWPRPIRVQLVSSRVREVLWSQRLEIRHSLTHYNVRISKDEPKEIRKARAILRNAAKSARYQGKMVYQHDDHIMINGQKYDLQNVHELEKGSRTYANVVAEKLPPKARDKENKNKLPCERKTKIGLAFFTEESKKSCFYPVNVTYKGVDYKTPEHNYQCVKALNSKKMELYHMIKEAKTPALAKKLGDRVPFNPEWEEIKPEVMYEIQLAKHEQHPELGEELCSVEGIFMEASKDHFWGTGATILDPALDDGEFCGRNELGKVLGRVQKTLLARRSIEMSVEENTDVHAVPHTDSLHTVGRHMTSGEVSANRPAGTTKGTTYKPQHLKNTQLVAVTPTKKISEIEVLEEDIALTPIRTRRVLEPEVVIKEGTIIV